MQDKLKTWVVNDYFTPNIKAEVILDALLTPYVAEIINKQCGLETVFVTKEMSIVDMEQSEQNPAYRNKGTKIDYILANEEAVYLVELKTTDSSIGKTQAIRYLSNCRAKTFGSVFGGKLLKIARDSFGETYKKDFSRSFGEEPKNWSDEALSGAFHLVFDNRFGKEYDMAKPSRPYARASMELIKKAGWAQSHGSRSRKYLYTMGQLMDYMYPANGEHRPLWNLPLKLLYLTPTGSQPHRDLLNCPEFYLHPKEIESVSLRAAAADLKQGDDLARLLAEIIDEIYGGD